MRRRHRWLIALLIIAVLALIVWPVLAGFYTDWLWFQNLGYQTVFSTSLTTKAMLGIIVGLLATIISWLNFKLAFRLSPEPQRKNTEYVYFGQTTILVDRSNFSRQLALPLALLIGLISGMIAWGAWDKFLLYVYQTQFGEVDPIFSRDIGFYFFTLPLWEIISNLIFIVVISCLIGTVLIYLIRSTDFIIEQRLRLDFRFEHKPRAHLITLTAILFLAFAFYNYLEIPNLLYSNSGLIAGAGYTDLNANLPILYIQIVIAIIAAALFVASIWMFKNRLMLLGGGAYLLIFIASLIYPSILQRLSVAPNEFVKETPYIEHNISATRRAFGLNQIVEREFSGENTLSARDIQDNRTTINNIRLWDQQPLLDTFSQIQEIRTYYAFNSVDNDRYRLNGELRQTMLSVRELSSADLPNRNWINEHLTFTHGFGLTLGPVNEVSPEGLPVLFVKDIPPSSSAPALKIDRPEIYFGEKSNDRVYVKTLTKEFNYPAGEQNVYANYEGKGGVVIDSMLRRLMFATRFTDLKLLISNDLTNESRVLYYCNIRERLNLIAPFLRFDNDPYMVIFNGRLYWIADAYTVSNRYPYSQPNGGINYIRNSIKALIDAYNGTVTLYITDEHDPLIKTYARIYPGTMKSLSEMPAGLREHLRYPEDIFRIQTDVYATYHMDRPQMFYNKEDMWAVATVGKSKEAETPHSMEPYYTIMKLPGENKEEFILMLPFTPQRKDNLASWMVARADGEHYGRLLVYRFPKQKLIYGPMQIVARINQDAEISRQITLWNQRGSEVLLGTLMIIPIKESLIYVQPLYLRAETGKIPELRRVIVVGENRIVMESTLEACLARIFNTTISSDTVPTNTVAESTPALQSQPSNQGDQSLAKQARQHYDNAIKAQRDGDWARYGEEIKQLGAVLHKMSKE